MHILPINGYSVYNKTENKSQFSSNATNMPSRVSPDKVLTFMARFPVSELYADSIAKKAKDIKMNELATNYLDNLESIANELKEFGVSFNRAYCEEHPIKGARKCVSKLMRVGEVRDWLRATLFIENPYDLSILQEKLFPALRKRGLILSDMPISTDEAIKRGFTPTTAELKKGVIRVDDLDIRLLDSAEHIAKTAPELKNFAGEPAKSGYEDIQMRLIRKSNNKKDPIYHELIILFGNNYAQAKKIESERIYDIIREFTNLSILKEGNLNSQDEMLVKSYINKIKKKFTTEASEKLFENAKNKDFFKIDEQATISFNLQDEIEINELFFFIEKLMEKHYKKSLYEAKANPQLKRSIRKNWDNDVNKLTEMRNRLKESIDYFNNEYGKEKPKRVKAKKSAKTQEPEKV